jgi:hypothetical protein
MDGVLGDHAWGVGASLIISAGLNFGVLQVQSLFEAIQLLMIQDCAQGKVVRGLTQLSFTVDRLSISV